MYNAEDDIERTIVPRLMAMGADLKNIVLYDESSFREYENGEMLKRSFDMTKDLPILATMLSKYDDVAVLICDPITGIWGGKDINRDREVVKVLEKLKVLCERKRLTFLGISHTNKRSDVSALEKVLGSSSITGKCRSAHYISQDPESDGEHDYVMAWAKGNLSGNKGGIKFSTVGVEMEFEGKKNSYPKVVWGEQTKDTADDVLAQKREKREAKDRKLEAAKVLIGLLLVGGPQKSYEVYNRGKDENIGKGTMERAADEMTKEKQILRKQKDRNWWMLLPEHLAEFEAKPVVENPHIPDYEEVFS
jgi:putative DNA primase/helicase